VSPVARLLIPDTNVLLDVVRSDVRLLDNRNPVGAAAHARTALDEVVRGDVQIGLVDLVLAEYQRGVDAVAVSAADNIRRIRNRTSAPRGSLLPEAEDVVRASRRVADDIVGAATLLPTTMADVAYADARYADRVAPAYRKASSTHDARIMETALRTAASRPPGTTWFMTRNPNDFTGEGITADHRVWNPQEPAEPDARQERLESLLDGTILPQGVSDARWNLQGAFDAAGLVFATGWPVRRAT
jgi:hypothetical protein